MANGGWYGTDKEWTRLEAPLFSLDPVLERFAAQHALDLRKNHKDIPDRSLMWGEHQRCLIQLFLADEAGPTWNLWLCCSEDRDNKRYWKQEHLVRDEPAPAFANKLEGVLAEAHQKVSRWQGDPSLLEFATELEPLPDLG